MAYFHTNVLDNAIKALPTVGTASGSTASFETDLTEDLIEVVCDIQYSQASGTPSPSNPLKILTFEDLTLYHNSINFWNERWELGSYDNAGQPIPSINAIRSKTRIACNPNTTYYFKGGANNDNSIKYFYDINDNYISNYGGTGSDAFTTPNDCAYMRFRMGSAYGTTYNNDISINYPSTDTAYHAFNGAYVPFGQTVAKGTLNVSTGVLTITHGYVDMGSLNWGSSTIPSTGIVGSQSISSLVKIPPSTSTVFNGACSHFLPTARNGQSNYQVSINNSGNVIICDTDFVGQLGTDLKTWLENNNVYLVYELETPLTVQLDSKTITALLDENNIWCDTNGDTKVKFLLSVGKAVA
jgi:hypothetical protein